MANQCGQCIDGQIQVGNKIRTTGTFTNALDNYNPIDPTTVMCTVQDPAGDTNVYTYGVDAEVQRTGVGAYYLEQQLDMPGQWYFKWEGTGNLNAVSERNITVLSIVT